MSFEGAHTLESQRRDRARAYVAITAFVEIVALIALFACWLGSIWGISIPHDASPYSAQDAAAYTGRAEDVLLVFGAAFALMVLMGIGAVVKGRPFFAALQLVGVIALLIICRQDASWAWHITHPLAAPPAWPTSTPTYQPCYSGSNTCN